MSYGYDSSTPSLTLNLNPKQIHAARETAKLLGLTQTRGATAGQGSLSQLVSQLAEAARTQGAAAVAHKLDWTRNLTATPRYTSHALIMIDPDSVPHLVKVAKRLGHVRHTGPRQRIGQGSANALVAAIAQAAHDEGAEAIARRLKWLTH